MKLSLITAAILAATLQVTSLPAAANEKAVVDAMESERLRGCFRSQ